MKKLLLIVAIALIVFSCEKETTKPLAQKDDVPEVYVKEGVLVFKNWDALFNTLESLENKDADYLDKWESNLGFKSLRNVYDCFNIEQELMTKELEKLYAENKELITEELVEEKYNSLLETYENSVLLVESEKENIKYYDMNLYHDMYAPIVNEYGIVSVQGKIYRYTRDDVRTLKDDDWSKLPELLVDNSPFVELSKIIDPNAKPNLDPTTSPGGIPIQDIDENCTAYTSSFVTQHQWEASGSDDNTVVKTIIYVKFLQTTYQIWDDDCNFTTYTKTNFYFKIRNLIKSMALINAPWVNYDVSDEYFWADIEYYGNYSNGEKFYKRINYDSFMDSGHTIIRTLMDCKTTYNHPIVRSCEVNSLLEHWTILPYETGSAFAKVKVYLY